MTKDYLAIDVGGTRLKVGLIDRSGNIIEKFSERTNSAGLEAFFFLGQLRDVIGRYDGKIRGVGFQPAGEVSAP